ncbi:MAG: hypothetical protein HZB67_00110, partial [Candidatus Aenigmarchaeota archaeon]|nr:hypothetical protein [Candidatus Aenigmarchaeota archaeon]
EVDVSSSNAGKLSVNLNGNRIDFFDIVPGTAKKPISNTTLVTGENTIEFTASGTINIQRAVIVAE